MYVQCTIVRLVFVSLWGYRKMVWSRAIRKDPNKMGSGSELKIEKSELYNSDNSFTKILIVPYNVN